MKKIIEKFLIISIFVMIIMSTFLSIINVYSQAENIVKIGWGGTSFDTFNPFTTYAQV